MSSPIVFITGANTGLGFETIRSLLRSQKTYNIILGGRNIAKADEAVQKLRSEYPTSKTAIASVQVDVEDDASIKKAFDHISIIYGQIDVLINNAGAQFDSEIAKGTMTVREAWNKSWNINTTGTHILTHTFVPLLLESSDPRLLFIASGTSTLTEFSNQALPLNRPPPKGWPKTIPSVTSYRSSKTGMNMMMREWSRILQEDGVKVWGVSPGFLATGLGGDQQKNKQMGAIDPVIGADFVRDVVEGVRDHDAGKVIRRDDVQAW